MLVLACAAPASATRGCAGYIGKGANHAHRCSRKACYSVGRVLAAAQGATRVYEQCNNERACPATHSGTKYGAVSFRHAGAASKRVVPAQRSSACIGARRRYSMARSPRDCDRHGAEAQFGSEQYAPRHRPSFSGRSGIPRVRGRRSGRCGDHPCRHDVGLSCGDACGNITCHRAWADYGRPSVSLGDENFRRAWSANHHRSFRVRLDRRLARAAAWIRQ